MSDDATVLTNVDDGVMTITLNRPDKRNAMNAELNDELVDALRVARGDDDVRAVIVTGAGKGFCAGADLTLFAQIDRPEFVRDYVIDNYKTMMELITSMKKPVIAAVNGSAAGAGASLALACDFRVMAEDASIYQAFIKIGLVPDAGSCWLLARQVGYSKALEIATSGEPVNAAQCAELGLANRVVGSNELMGAANEWAQQLSRMPTRAIAMTKEAMHFAMDHDLGKTIEREAELQARAVQTHDHKEGVSAFLEKRDPDFKGE
jgi:2-(1,2-epoxy-1,2-dihydrophenyl)acetyl-CoA isomerase